MRGVKRGLRWVGKRLCRLFLLTALALAIGLGWGWRSTAESLPSLNGNVWAMLGGEDLLLMVLSNGENNCLVRTDYSGRVLNYADTAADEAYQYMEASGNTIYAIRNICEEGKIRQEMVSFSAESPLMRPKVLLELSSLDGAPEGIVWKQLYMPEGSSQAFRLVGIDEGGQGYLLRWEPDTGGVALEEILEGESLFFLKYVREGRYAWIGRDGRAGQETDGIRQYDVLAGKADTPYFISTCGQRCFLSDSLTGNIYELAEDGSAALFRRGDEEIGDSGLRYREMGIFTTQPGPDGVIHPLAFCLSPEGDGMIAGDLHTVCSLDLNGLLPLIILVNGSSMALLALLALIALDCALSLLLHSRRLAVRLSVCELLVELALIAALMLAQLVSFQDTIQSGARQKLLMLGGNLAYVLSSDREMDDEETARIVARVRRQLETAMDDETGEYAVSVYRSAPEGLVTVYDREVPPGVLAEDVRNRNYLREVRSGMASSGQVTRVRNANNVDDIYVESFRQGTQEGCVAVVQAEEAILADQTTFLEGAVPILAACPVMFLLLMILTRRLLRPLDDIRKGLELFFETRGGNTIPLDRMSRTELYEIARVFNGLSIEIKRKFNDQRTIIRAYARLVPDCLLEILGKASIQEVSPGDSAGVDGAVLVLLPEIPARTAAELETRMASAAERIQACGGFLVDYDERMGSITAVFAQAEHARVCAGEYLDVQSGVTAAVFAERVEVGVFGSEKLLYLMAVSQSLHRRLAALARLREFGAVLIHSGAVTDSGSLRLLGWAGGLTYYEDTALRESEWQTRWLEVRELWDQAMELFRARGFDAAMRRFARILRVLPEDGAARWYLFRCDTLRGAADAGTVDTADTELLFDWREADGTVEAPNAGD